MASIFAPKNRVTEYTSVDLDYEIMRVAVTTRDKNGLTVRVAQRNINTDAHNTFPENSNGDVPSPEVTNLLSLNLKEMFDELNAPLAKVGINSPDRNTILNIFTTPPLKPKDLKSAVQERVAALAPAGAPSKSGFHQLSKTKRDITGLISIIQSPFADALANVVRNAGGSIDLMQPRIISSINTITSLMKLPDHPLLLAHLSRNSTGTAVLKPIPNTPNSLQWARVIPLGGAAAVEQHTRFTRELTDTIQRFRTNNTSPASIILLGREHNNEIIEEAAKAANLILMNLDLKELTIQGDEVDPYILPSLLGLALTRMNP